MDTAYARRQMVRQQVRTWDVTDEAVLNLLGELPRDRFVPAEYRDLAYADVAIPLPNEQSMMPPLVEGRVLQALKLRADDKVLEVGTGSGFLTACLASLTKDVTSIDVFGDLLAMAQHNLDRVGIENTELLSMDASAELPDGSFDVIAITGSTPEFDIRYADALSPGGRLFVIIGDAPVMQARIVTRTESGELSSTALFETVIDPLINSDDRSGFSF